MYVNVYSGRVKMFLPGRLEAGSTWPRGAGCEAGGRCSLRSRAQTWIGTGASVILDESEMSI